MTDVGFLGPSHRIYNKELDLEISDPQCRYSSDELQRANDVTEMRICCT